MVLIEQQRLVDWNHCRAIPQGRTPHLLPVIVGKDKHQVARNDISTSAHGLIVECLHGMGRQVVVAVAEHHIIALGHHITRLACLHQSTIALMGHDAETAVAGSVAVDHLHRVVGCTVVDHDDFKVVEALRQYGLQTAGDLVLYIIYRYDNRYFYIHKKYIAV